VSALPIDSEKVVGFHGVEAFNRRSRYRLEDFDTLEPGALTWRVKGLWPAVGVCFVGGPSMSGKSFWTLDACGRICRGLPVLGRKSKRAGVAYIAAEGELGVRNRIAALRQAIGKLGGRFKYLGQRPSLTDPEDVADLSAALGDARAELAERGDALGLVVVDTLSASVPGADENSAADMSPVLAALQDMAVQLQTLILVVAHTGKDETRGLRGWSGQLGNADGVIMLTEPSESEGDTIRSGNVLKVKDGPSGDRFGFALAVVELGRDEDGDAITSCIIEDREAPEGSKAGRRPTVKQANAALVAAAFNRVFDDRAVSIAASGAPSGIMGVRLGDLRTEALTMGLGPPEPDLAGMNDAERAKARKGWSDHRNKTFTRALEELRAGGGWRIEHEYIWPLGRTERGAV